MASPSTTFSQTIACKLDEKNYMNWHQQYLSEEDRAVGTINPKFTNWDRQDALIMSWLLSTLSDSILSRVVTFCHSLQVWNTIRFHFHGLTRARTTQLRLELQTIKKGNKSCTTGDAISNREQTDAILIGLPPEYEALISTVTTFLTRDADVSVLDIETMILTHEGRLEQHKQTALQEPLTLNLAECLPHCHLSH
ncbi:Retrovirus-related Pol polyprotein from transposon RE1 [Glycine soja]|uniref:Retrovirus-related Pol polyprotein from transposon RE1 n=1 Tax=Glycine soja TaxID=3848 RepID=A0A445KCU5_GLYSO|nr:Retrovirus-related Pol polyprotein from transposon RE1 [Glycine soja]